MPRKFRLGRVRKYQFKKKRITPVVEQLQTVGYITTPTPLTGDNHATPHPGAEASTSGGVIEGSESGEAPHVDEASTSGSMVA